MHEWNDKNHLNKFLTQIIVADEMNYFERKVDNSAELSPQLGPQQPPLFAQVGLLLLRRFHIISI